MNGTASRKRGWLVFGICTMATLALFARAVSRPDLARWAFPLLGVLTAVAGKSMLVVTTWHAGRYWGAVE
ncbi:hypothetical protein [Pseudorhodobacter ferrugineus]|uniref:hypothetical protein n=1 Tax=Pseudorhodobacter ferrugineus TaxID=77008 RepID=UPI0012DCF759|nr:hypothetical protein [Pseudorhodobacter ferrugineus]